ncbi:hypothetical protein JGH11_04650 [Dysgonomonas sp. Marseille-P4677]|uniref:hypothetical protein n=1 Tax=Dysgonomonas sp. Marseille-P4677 TaxID=2364790 RepID=UPI001912317E|nr:hypothetical protein [Dysgonomonas sp. Marseille-P4677]MBK5720157.1 hypothetical protein [Dysgonomonas sp. Marseille-P4677]
MAKKFTSKIGLQPVYSTKDPNGNPATKGEKFTQITRDNYELIEEELENKADEVNETGKVVRTSDGTVDISDKADKTNDAGDFVAYSKDGKAITPTDFEAELKKKADGLYVDQDNKLWLKSGENTIGTGIELPKSSGGVPNVSEINDKYDYTSKQAARIALPVDDRKKGQVITYQLASGVWVLDQFNGDSLGSWNNDGSWRSFVSESELKGITTDIESLKNNIIRIDTKTEKIPSDFDLDDDNKLYLITSSGERINDGIQLPEGGGGGSTDGVLMKLRIVGLSTMTVGEDKDVFIKYDFTSIERGSGDATGPGTYSISVNGINVANGAANQGENTFNLKGLIFLGSNIVVVRVIDNEGTAKKVTWNIQVAALSLTSTFADDTVYNTNPVLFRYTPIGIGNKTIRFFLDGTELSPDQTETSGRQMTKNLTGLTNGSHTIRAIAESTVAGSALTSNELYYEFIYADAAANKPVIALSYNKTEVEQFSMIDIPFLIYNPAGPTAGVTIRVNGQLVSQLTVPRTKQNFTYQANTEGPLAIVFTCGAISKTLNITVNKSGFDIREELSDLEYKAFAVGKSNSGNDRDNWNYNGHASRFTGFSWADDGWQKDAAGNNCLRLIGDSKVEIDIHPFTNDILITGATLTVEYSTKQVTDDQSVIMSSVFSGIGVVFTPTSVTLQSAQSILTTKFNSDEKISISIVVQKLSENRLAYLFVDGVASGTLQYPASDNFTQSAQKPFELSTGNRSCQLQVYGIRWYKNSLNFDQILGNYIFDIENLEEKMIVYTRNQIVDAYGNIDYNKALQFLPCLTYIGDEPSYKGDKKINDIIFEDRQRPANSFTSIGAQVDVQGTSSQFYPRTNKKIKLQNGVTYTESGLESSKYQLEEGGIAASVLCEKVDFAESSGMHNVGMAKLVDQMLKEYGIFTPPQETNPKVRATIYGRAVLSFRKETASSQAVFRGKSNLNFDKAALEVFGFTAGCQSWEFKNNTSKLCLWKNADFSNWKDDIEARYPEDSEDISDIRELWEWVISCIGNPDKFKAECDLHFDVQNLLFYYLHTEHYVMTDQRAKNQFVTTYGKVGRTGKKIFCFLDYDNDTLGPINNEGRTAFSPYVEDMDRVNTSYVWNGWDSELWRLVRVAYPEEIKSMYQNLRQRQILSLSRTMDVFQKEHALKWCELVYNKDGKFKYIDPLVEGYYDWSSGNPIHRYTSEFIYALQGSRLRYESWFFKERFDYMDSKYNIGNHRTDTVSMRLYTPTDLNGLASDLNFKVTMCKPGYVRILFGSYLTTGIRCVKGESYQIDAPTGVQLNDTECVVYGVSAIKSLGDLSGKYIGTIDISRAYTLEDAIVGSTAVGYKNTNLKSFGTGANGKLRKVNVANCPDLKQALDFSQCYSLEEIEARGSGITGISLTPSGVLKKAYLPATFAAIVLRNQPHLEVYTLEGYANVNTVIIDNVPGIDGYALVKNCINTAGSKLTKVRLIDINASDTNSAILNAIASMTGEDENGIPTDKAIVTGKIHLQSITQGALDRFKIAFPNLTITYSNLLQVIDFEDNIVKMLMVANYDTNKDGEISPSEVALAELPTGLLSDSGAKLFSEAHYWGGTSVVDLCDTLKSASLLTGKTTLRNLSELKEVTVHQSAEDTLDKTPLLWSSQSVTNCYTIEKWNLSGRYSENSKKGVVLGRVNADWGIYYQYCYALRGYTDIVIDENCAFDDTYESTYPHGSAIKSLTLNYLAGLTVGNLPNLVTVNINGFSRPATIQAITLQANRSFRYLNIGGIGILGNFRQAGIANVGNTNPIEIIIGDGISSGTGTSSIGPICATSNTATYINKWTKLDLGKNINSTIVVGSLGHTTGHRNTACIGTLIIRNENSVLPLSFSPGGWYSNLFEAVYVPDNLVASYKAATNWSNASSVIKALSLLG